MIAGTTIMIEGIKFKILSLNIEHNMPIGMFGYQISSNSREIKMIAETSMNNYLLMNKWFDGMFDHNGRSKSASYYKKNINYNGVQITGLFLINYTCTQKSIEVTFSIDHIDGDFNLFHLKQLRKEKLKKISECQKYS